MIYIYYFIGHLIISYINYRIWISWLKNIDIEVGSEGHDAVFSASLIMWPILLPIIIGAWITNSSTIGQEELKK